MMLHLGAISYEMSAVIKSGPIKITQEVPSFPTSSRKDKETDKGDDEVENDKVNGTRRPVTPRGSQDLVEIFVPKQETYGLLKKKRDLG